MPEGFCACAQMYQEQSNCECPYNFNHAIYCACPRTRTPSLRHHPRSAARARRACARP